MTDRDLQIGALQQAARNADNQRADLFRRVDALEVAVSRLETRLEGGALYRSLPAAFSSWRLWAAVLGLLGTGLGLWTIDDIRGIFGLGPP